MYFLKNLFENRLKCFENCRNVVINKWSLTHSSKINIYQNRMNLKQWVNFEAQRTCIAEYSYIYSVRFEKIHELKNGFWCKHWFFFWRFEIVSKQHSDTTEKNCHLQLFLLKHLYNKWIFIQFFSVSCVWLFQLIRPLMRWKALRRGVQFFSLLFIFFV